MVPASPLQEFLSYMVSHLTASIRRAGFNALLAFFAALPAVGADVGAPSRPDSEPVAITAADMFSGRYDYQFVRITGTIQDLFHDDNNSLFRFFIIFSGNETIFAPSQTISESDAALESLIGAEVSVAGTCDVPSAVARGRMRLRRNLYIWDLKDITILKPAPESPFDVPPLEGLSDASPSEIPRLGRRRFIGRVLAVWDGMKALLEGPDGRLVRIEPKKGPPPVPGDFIEAVGLPESDIYRINLTRAVWRKALPFPVTAPVATNVAARTILTDPRGQPGIKPEFHGRLIRLRGIVRSLPIRESPRFFLQDGSDIVPVDTTSAPEIADKIELGATIAVDGICVTEVEPWRPGAVFPRTNGFILAPRPGDALEILASPPWWTPARFLGVIGALTLLLAAALIWNRSLRILAERRGKTLLREQLGRVQNQLKIGERTRLAVELHDSISQSLAGASFQIKAARNLAAEDPAAADRHLSLAARTLLFCRNELRNCIWELRSQTLEATRMDDAIRQTLQPHLGSAQLNVRFNVHRRRLSDDTAHALLRIIRELASNAVRHGRATRIQIAGCLDGDKIVFSVADNGCGFDPDHCPGVNEGHFGLQGVRERVASQDGSLAIESRPGAGTRVAVSLALQGPKVENEGEN